MFGSREPVLFIFLGLLLIAVLALSFLLDDGASFRRDNVSAPQHGCKCISF